jgi:hypothetical protein
MNRIISTSLLALMSVSAGGCATVMHGTHQDLTFKSEPDGAKVALSTGQTCTAPCTFSVKRGDDLRVDFERAGYKAEYVYVQSRLGAATFGNVIAGGIIGGVVDGSNGASNHLYPSPVSVRLAQAGSSEEGVLLDEKGAVISSIAAHNNEVGEDVREGIAGQGLVERPRSGG